MYDATIMIIVSVCGEYAFFNLNDFGFFSDVTTVFMAQTVFTSEYNLNNLLCILANLLFLHRLCIKSIGG